MSPALPAAPTTPATPAACEELFSLRRAVSSLTLPGGGLHLLAWPHTQPLGRLTPGQHAVLRALAGQAHTVQALAALAAGHRGDAGHGAKNEDAAKNEDVEPSGGVEPSGEEDHDGQAGGPDGVAPLLGRLCAGGWLKVTVSMRGQPLYTTEPLRPPPPPPPPPGARATLVLSRFALLHRDDDDGGGGLVLESPGAWCDIRIHDPALLAVLGRPADPGDGEAATRLAHDLYRAGMAVPAGSEDGELRTRQWSPHELWFHDRSRLGYRGFLGDGFAGTFWARGRFDPLPARPEPFPGPAVDLHRPDLDALRRTDPPLSAVLEDRRSVRAQDEADPVTATQLGEFLYRCARTRRVGMSGDFESADRPYPSGGAMYELEVYPVVRHATGIAPGMYHYDSHAHQLRPVREITHPAVRRLLRASPPGEQERPPQILLVVSARPGRLMWKYEAIGYSLTLKHLGVLYQTMYLVATAMGLAPCAIGAGDSIAFTEATGRDPLTECGVGEFTLGSLPPGGSPAGTT